MNINCIYIYFLIFIILLSLLGIFNNSENMNVYSSRQINENNYMNSLSTSCISMSNSKDISCPMNY